MNTQTLPSSYQSSTYEPYSQQYEIDNFFSLTITQRKRSTRIIMQLIHQQVDTEHIPTVVDLLEEKLPSVLQTTCYNEGDLPFNVEVQNTEIGHLFEHILLEYLCQYKIAKGASKATYAGRTKWNWYRDPRGKFHIYLNCGNSDADILPLALDKTIALMKIILEYSHEQLFIHQALQSTHHGLKNGKRSKRKK